MKVLEKKWLVRFLAILGVLMVCAFVKSTPVSAADDAQNMKNYEALEKNQFVHKVFENDICITENFIEYNLGYKSKVMAGKAKRCSHTSLVRYGDAHFSKESIKNSSTYCYKTRYWYYAKCTKCGKKGFKSYDPWTKHKHHYRFLGKKCTECGYKKK